jgi:hypothetical protein
MLSILFLCKIRAMAGSSDLHKDCLNGARRIRVIHLNFQREHCAGAVVVYWDTVLQDGVFLRAVLIFNNHMS